MGMLELFFIAVGLSMDAFAVSACIGLNLNSRKSGLNEAITAGIYFGTAQAVMPLAGYYAGSRFADKISDYSGYIAFVILAFIGGKMLKESFDKSNNKINADVNFKKMLPLAAATSIDALSVGISFAFLNVNIFSAVSFIGIITFILSATGVKIGGILGLKFKSKAEFSGGLILILIGAKILIEHWEII